jgi:hypothetical protein
MPWIWVHAEDLDRCLENHKTESDVEAEKGGGGEKGKKGQKVKGSGRRSSMSGQRRDSSRGTYGKKPYGPPYGNGDEKNDDRGGYAYGPYYDYGPGRHDEDKGLSSSHTGKGGKGDDKGDGDGQEEVVVIDPEGASASRPEDEDWGPWAWHPNAWNEGWGHEY